MRLFLSLLLLLCAASPLLAQDPPPAGPSKVEQLEKELTLLRRQLADLRAQMVLNTKKLDEQALELARLREALAKAPPTPPKTTDEEARRYKEAVRITVARKVEEYALAVELLKEIPETSELHADARALLAWLDADQQVRRAQELYDEGQARGALELLEKVLQLEVLGPNARDGVRLRRQRISVVVRAYEKAVQLQKSGDAPASRRAFAEVLALEPSGMNFFRRQARVELAQLLAAISGRVLDDAEAVAKAGDDARKKNARLTLELLLEGLAQTHPHRKRAEAALEALKPAEETQGSPDTGD